MNYLDLIIIPTLFSIGWALIAIAIALLIFTLSLTYQARALELEESKDIRLLGKRRRLVKNIKKTKNCLRLAATIVSTMAIVMLLFAYLL
jgi:hypothetical protein